MPQRVVVIHWCSLCGEESNDEPLAQWTLNGPPGNYELDVCKTCAESEFWHQLVDAATQLDTPKRKHKAVVSGMVNCPDCGDEFTEGGINQHRSRKHGRMSPTQAAEQRRAKAAEKSQYTCEDCGYKAVAPQGLAAHRRIHVVEEPIEVPVKRRSRAKAAV